MLKQGFIAWHTMMLAIQILQGLTSLKASLPTKQIEAQFLSRGARQSTEAY